MVLNAFTHWLSNRISSLLYLKYQKLFGHFIVSQRNCSLIPWSKISIKIKKQIWIIWNSEKEIQNSYITISITCFQKWSSSDFIFLSFSFLLKSRIIDLKERRLQSPTSLLVIKREMRRVWFISENVKYIFLTSLHMEGSRTDEYWWKYRNYCRKQNHPQQDL